MLRCIAIALVFVGSACAAILPAQLGPHQLASSQPVEITADRAVWDEYGLQTAERGDYGAFRATAYRLKDTTGAYAAGQWLRATDTSAATLGNYVLTCTGKCPPAARLSEWLTAAAPPGLSHAAYPSLDGYMPTKGLIPGSKRYVLGPQSLALFEPRVPAQAADFDFNAEGQLAKYRSAKGDQTLVLFSYPTLQMARQQVPAFEKIPGATVKRAGPIVAVVLGSPDSAAAANLLGQVNYEASISMNQPLPLVLKPQSAAQMILAIFSLCGLVLAFCLVSGLAYGGILVAARKFGYLGAHEQFVTLHLTDQITPRISPR